MIKVLSTSLWDKVITWKAVKKENVIANADTKDLAKKRHVKNCNNIERATLIIIAWNIIASPYNISKEWSNHDPQI